MASFVSRQIGLSLLVLLGAAVVDPIQEVAAFSANVGKAPSSSVASVATSTTSSSIYDGLSSIHDAISPSIRLVVCTPSKFMEVRYTIRYR